MIVTFGKGYLCCGCKIRYTKRKTAFIYKENCICKECYEKFEAYSASAYFEAAGNVDYLAPAFRYKNLYREIFLNFKFNSHVAYGHLLGMAIAEQMKTRDEITGYSYIIPVPVSKERFNERGYNQSEVLADYVSKSMGIPMITSLKRVKHSAPQSTVESAMRAENVKGAFITDREFSGENVILFDDIFTTGSTVAECAKTLQKAGAGKICAISGAYNQVSFIDRTIHRFI